MHIHLGNIMYVAIFFCAPTSHSNVSSVDVYSSFFDKTIENASLLGTLTFWVPEAFNSEREVLPSEGWPPGIRDIIIVNYLSEANSNARNYCEQIVYLCHSNEFSIYLLILHLLAAMWTKKTFTSHRINKHVSCL